MDQEEGDKEEVQVVLEEVRVANEGEEMEELQRPRPRSG